MSDSVTTEPARPLSDRARDWLFRLTYAHLLGGRSVETILAQVPDLYVIEDEQWEQLHGLSPYVPDPRLGHLPRTVWARIGPEVSACLRQLAEQRPSLEDAIRQASTRWRLERIAVIDRALLMVGAFELLSRQSRPARRVINRTVELAKRYGAADSRRFVNGMLDQIRKDHGIEAG